MGQIDTLLPGRRMAEQELAIVWSVAAHTGH
jgi:hypothetical protein